MYQVIIVVHVLLGMGVIGLILMQQGKGADAGAAFGSGASGSVFGAQGAASFLSRTTAILATSFFVTSLTLAVLSGKQEKPVDLMDTPDSVQKVSDVPVANTPTVPVVSGGAVESSAAEKPTLNPVTDVAVPAAAVGAAVKAVEPAQAVTDKPKADDKPAESKKSEAKKVKVIKAKDKKDADKKHKDKTSEKK
jgi:preprotein translocase subunit SecG